MAPKSNIWLIQTETKLSLHGDIPQQSSFCCAGVVTRLAGARKGGETSASVDVYCPFPPAPNSTEQHLMSEIFYIKDSQPGDSRTHVCFKYQ